MSHLLSAFTTCNNAAKNNVIADADSSHVFLNKSTSQTETSFAPKMMKISSVTVTASPLQTSAMFVSDNFISSLEIDDISIQQSNSSLLRSESLNCCEIPPFKNWADSAHEKSGVISNTNSILKQAATDLSSKKLRIIIEDRSLTEMPVGIITCGHGSTNDETSTNNLRKSPFSGNSPFVQQSPQQSIDLETIQSDTVQHTQSKRKNALPNLVYFSEQEPRKVRQVVDIEQQYGDHISAFEKSELRNYSTIYYTGGAFSASLTAVENNSGFDNEAREYIFTIGGHIAYRYEILELLGRGAFAIVVKAFDHKQRIEVAIKISNNTGPSSHQALMEIEVLRLLKEKAQCKNAVKILRSFIFRSHVCVVLELLVGGDLYSAKKHAKGHILSIAKARNYIRGLMQCLCELHAYNIMHCDLKPDNILLADATTDQVKLIDFGYCCIANGDLPYDHVQSLCYRAPEVILGARFGLAIDIWSVGCMLAEFVTGAKLFPGIDEASQLMYQMELAGAPSQETLLGCKNVSVLQRSQPLQFLNHVHGVHAPGSATIARLLGNKGDSELVDFLARCLAMNPVERITAPEAIIHPFLADYRYSKGPVTLVDSVLNVSKKLPSSTIIPALLVVASTIKPALPKISSGLNHNTNGSLLTLQSSALSPSVFTQHRLRCSSV